MTSGTVKLGELPLAIKAAFVLFAFHIAVYSADIAWIVIVVEGASIHPLWALHIAVALYFLSAIRRPSKSPAMLVGYCFLTSFLISRNEYNHAIALGNLAEVIPSLLLCVLPLLLAGVCVLLGRHFYSEGASVT